MTQFFVFFSNFLEGQCGSRGHSHTESRPVKSPAFGGWHPHLTLISSTPASIDVSSRIPMILPHWSRFWFVFSVKVTRPSFPAKSCVVWLPRTLFVRLCTYLMIAWIVPYLAMRSLVWRHLTPHHNGELFRSWFDWQRKSSIIRRFIGASQAKKVSVEAVQNQV